MSLIRGVLVAGGFRTHRQLVGVSNDDQRNTLIVELGGRTNQSGAHFQAMDDATLAGAGAVLVFLREAKVRDDAQLKTISDDDQRNLMIIEMGAQTNLSGPVLQGLSNLDLARMALGGDPLRDQNLRNLILAKYNKIGGQLSPLGLPVDVQMRLINTAQGPRMDFRGGPITIPPGNLLPIAIKQFSAEVWWVGIECQIRQEGTDEIYGGVGVLVPGSGLSRTEKFPDDDGGTSDMGPDGMRIINIERKLYEGPPTDIVLTASLIEHDSGDTSEVKAKIAEAVSKAAQGLAAFVGIPAEAASADQGFINDLSLGLVNAIGDAFGIGDDPYPTQQLRLRWTEIQGRQFVRKTVRRDDDPRTIEFTHSITVSGEDDGGDRGQYALYFDVRLFVREEVVG